MPVSLPLTFDLSSESEFYTQVSAGMQAAQQANCQFLSLGISLPTVDPLILLAGLMQVSGESEHFYLEQAGEIVAACGAVATRSVQGHQRFVELQRFSEQTLSRVWAIAPAEPRLFCQFSFWDHLGSNRGLTPLAGDSASGSGLAHPQLCPRDQYTPSPLARLATRAAGTDPHSG